MSDGTAGAFFRGAELLLGAAFAAAAFALGSVPPAPRPALGRLGERRARALAMSALFRMAEPLVLQLAAWTRRVSPDRWRSAVAERLARAGHEMGLTADELVAVSLLAAAFGGGVAAAGLAAGVASTPAAPSVLAAAVAAGALPALRVRADEKRRGEEMSRRLPGAIDLLSLCMSAGVDFPGALRFVVGDARDVGRRDLAREELAQVIQALEVGHTRSEALSDLARRVPCDAVTSFVAAVVQSEEKGNPLSELLLIQARVLRGRRSLAAEEAAARAGVLMVGPLLLLLACVLVLLLGPFVLSGGF